MIKNKCLYNKINIIDAGPKGVLLGFKNNFFNNADKLLGWVTKKSGQVKICLLYTSPSPRDATLSRMPSSA